MNLLFEPCSRGLVRIANASRAWRAILLLLTIAVAYLALTPQPPPSIDTGWDKLNHMLAFSALAFAACLSWPQARKHHYLLWWTLLFLGGSIEVLQLYVPGRASEWGDLLADAVGIGCGAITGGYLLNSVTSISATLTLPR
jgi:VanZ family protein